jgi:dihydrofolate reductase
MNTGARLTYEVALTRFNPILKMSKKVVVVSTTLDPAQHPGATIVRSGVSDAVAAIKSQPGKDVWLFGGGKLFRGLLDAKLVDTIEVTVIPVPLGSGVSLLPAGQRRVLHPDESKALLRGILTLKYTAEGNHQGVEIEIRSATGRPKVHPSSLRADGQALEWPQDVQYCRTAVDDCCNQ